MSGLARAGGLLAAVGVVAIATAAIAAPARAAAALLWAGYAVTGIGLAAAFFVAMAYTADATWTVALRRVPEALTRVLPFSAGMLGLVFLLFPWLYPWTHPEEAESFIGFKRFWLDRPFFLARAAVYFAIWIGFAAAIIRNSRRQDIDGDVRWTRANARLSALFLVLFAITVWLASVDWIMSLTPHWFSTMFGVWNFAAFFQGGLALILVLVVWLETIGPLRGVIRTEHIHDLGKLLFAFSTFYMYIWFSQYMLIWYANIPEETVYFIPRMDTAWRPLVLTVLTLTWLAPFLLLMSRPAKRSRGLLAKVAAGVLVGYLLALYVMIVPAISPQGPIFGLAELGALAMAAGVVALAFGRAFAQAPPVPHGDVFLAESRHYHS